MEAKFAAVTDTVTKGRPDRRASPGTVSVLLDLGEKT
jgi:hypothetical protein